MTCEERQELMVLYAAQALEPEVQDDLLGHLRSGCPRCTGNLAEAEAVLAHLPLVLEPVAPSPTVRQRLMERISQEATEERLRVVEFPPGGRADRWLDAWLKPAIAAGLAAAVVYGVAVLPAHRQREGLQGELLRQAEEIRRLQSDIELATQTARLLQSREAVVALLQGSEPQPQAWGRILWDRSTGTVHFYTGGLEPPGPGRTYELWLITANQEKIPAGTFDVGASRKGLLTAKVPKEIGPVALFAVTDEPAGGAPQPTGSIQLVGKI